jgi:MFS family permease
MFLLGVGIFTLASLLCGLAPSPLLLVLARMLQGAGAALMFPQTLTGIQLNFAGESASARLGCTPSRCPPARSSARSSAAR